jgi:hypothetical protein
LKTREPRARDFDGATSHVLSPGEFSSAHRGRPQNDAEKPAAAVKRDFGQVTLREHENIIACRSIDSSLFAGEYWHDPVKGAGGCEKGRATRGAGCPAPWLAACVGVPTSCRDHFYCGHAPRCGMSFRVWVEAAKSGHVPQFVPCRFGPLEDQLVHKGQKQVQPHQGSKFSACCGSSFLTLAG